MSTTSNISCNTVWTISKSSYCNCGLTSCGINNGNTLGSSIYYLSIFSKLLKKCVLKWVLHWHFLGIKKLQWNESLRSFMSDFDSFWSPCLLDPKWKECLELAKTTKIWQRILKFSLFFRVYTLIELFVWERSAWGWQGY